MTGGVLSPSFSGAVFKRLSAVETDIARSNQHEFNGSKPLIGLFGREHPQKIQTDFIRMSDEGGVLAETGMLTWYDARARHPTRSEYRLYYYDNAVTAKAREGDILLIGKRHDHSTLVLMAPGSGLAAARIAWLFGIEVEPGAAFAALDLDDNERAALGQGLGIALDTGSLWESEIDPVLAHGEKDGLPAVRAVQQLVGKEREWKSDGDWPPAVNISGREDGSSSSLTEIKRLLGGSALAKSSSQ
ncbi:hypothetical protein [Sinorhizobium meliloti]|uniref:hypothetical protein n=1 Tax=Rhizobium meliloti TaxID=382 RepID=UPI000FD99CE8|nr:hypothetical protein [Sinorhizobium meliloti]RVN54213.1 hypothetical protein CN108_18505 [Sinorhizobium meliloti]